MIDRKRLSDMERDFGTAEVAQIVEAFLEEASAAVETLRAGWADERLRLERLHFLKGCARTVGAMRLGDACERLESGGHVAEGFQLLDREFRSVREALGPERFENDGLREAG